MSHYISKEQVTWTGNMVHQVKAFSIQDTHSHMTSASICIHVQTCTYLFKQHTHMLLLTYNGIEETFPSTREEQGPRKNDQICIKPRRARILQFHVRHLELMMESSGFLSHSALLPVARTIFPWGQLYSKFKASLCACLMVLPSPALSGSLKLWSKIPQSR